MWGWLPSTRPVAVFSPTEYGLRVWAHVLRVPGRVLVRLGSRRHGYDYRRRTLVEVDAAI